MAARFVTRSILAAGLSFLVVGGVQARDLEVGKDKEYKLPSDAIGAAKAGDTVKIYPGEYFDCAIVHAKNLTIIGVGDADKILMTDKACAGKGMLVIDANDVTVKNLTLTRARVPDGNGAGIRNEAPNLTVDHVLFVNNQNGILSTPQTPGIVTVMNSVFDRNGGCANSGGCAHGLYVGETNLLHVENTTFTGTKEGHHIKSRALRTEVIGCTIEDGEDGTASYEVEVPIGGSVVVKNTKMEKGPQAENHTAMIIIGAEGVSQPTREITIEDNTARNDGDFNTIFVKNITATEAMLKGNVLTGPIKPLDGDGKVIR
jgi:hypothetical protein